MLLFVVVLLAAVLLEHVAVADAEMLRLVPIVVVRVRVVVLRQLPADPLRLVSMV